MTKKKKNNSKTLKIRPEIPCIYLLFTTFILLWGCDFEKDKNYRKAKEIMELGTMDARMETHALMRDSTINIIDNRRPADYTCLELAAELFDTFGDYKKSKKLAGKARYEAATYFYEKYEREQNRLYWERAYRLFSKAGEYADAIDKTLNYSASVLKKDLDFNETKKHDEFPKDIAKLFDVFDEKSKETHAHIIFEYAATHLGSPDWGKDDVSTFKNTLVRKEKRESFLYDLYLLNIIKEYKYATEDLCEKMYRVGVDRVDNDKFWKEEARRINSYELKNRKHLQAEIFDYLDNYKNSRNWLKRIKEFDFCDAFITQTAYSEMADQTGSDPHPRTILILISSEQMDLDNSFYIKSDVHNLAKWLKSEIRGNVFFTRNPSEACIVIEKKISHTFYKSFRYTGKINIVKYYHTNVVMKIQTADGRQLWEKNMKSTNMKPYSEVGTNVKKVFFEAPYAHPDMLEILNSYFNTLEKSPSR